MVSRNKIPPEGEAKMSYSLYDAAVAAAHCAANKIEESALLQDQLYSDMFCLARQIR